MKDDKCLNLLGPLSLYKLFWITDLNLSVSLFPPRLTLPPQITFSWEGLEAAKTSLTRLYELAFEWGDPGEVHRPTLKAIQKDLNDDLAMPKALATLWRMVKSDLAPSKKATL